jgi:hypothetical protein
MKLTGFMVVLLVALLFLIPTMQSEHEPNTEVQAQEESPVEKILEQENTYKIIYRAKSPQEDPIADIVWMKKAAEVSQDAGIPYFNVLEQEIYQEYDQEQSREVTVVEGIIELDKDPMRAEFDAQEIQSLILTQ